MDLMHGHVRSVVMKSLLVARRLKVRSFRRKKEKQHKRKRFEEGIKILLDHRFWARHPGPFNKSPRGYKRRQERFFHRMEIQDVLL